MALAGSARTSLRLGADERKALDHLAARLLNGEAVAPEALEYYGITVRYLGDNVEIIEVPRG